MQQGSTGAVRAAVNNISLVEAENVVVVVTLPDETPFDNSVPSPDVQDGQVLTYNFASLPAAAQQIIDIQVQTPTAGTFPFLVEATTTTAEAVLGNNSATANIEVTRDLGACSVAIPGPVAWDGKGGDCFECYAEGPEDILNPLAGTGFSGNPWIISSGTVITNTPVSSIQDNRMCLNASSGARVVLPSDWTVIRIGFRMTIDDNGAFGVNPAGPRGYMGLLANPSASLANGPVGASTSNFVGFAFGGALFQGNGWNRATTPSVYYQGPGLFATTKVGASAGNGSGLGVKISANPNIRPMYIIEITRGATYTCSLICVTGVNGLVDVPYADTLVAMGSATPRDYLNTLVGGTPLNGYAELGVPSMVVNEITNGVPNAIVFGWEHSQTTWRISEALFGYLT